jgi:hypothetical protein
MLNIQSEKLAKWADVTFRVLLLVVLGIIAWRIPSIPPMPSKLDVDARIETSNYKPIWTRNAR